MGIRNAGTIIKEARLKAGLTQEQLSFGICSHASICNIEAGRLGVSPSTFHALMSRAGAPSEIYPQFKDLGDFNAFTTLKNIRLFTDTNCLSLAYNELIKLKLINYGNNKLYYQEALLFYARIHYLTYKAEYSQLLDTLSQALSITHSCFDLNKFNDELLSDIDYEIIFLIASVYINMGNLDKALIICTEAEKKLSQNLTDDKYKAYMMMLCKFTLGKCLMRKLEYEKAKEYVDSAYLLSDNNYIEAHRVEIIITKMINDYMLDPTSISYDLLYMLSLASHLGYGFVRDLKHYLVELKVPQKYLDVKDPPEISLPPFDFEVPVESMASDSFDLFDKNIVTIGSLIKFLRKFQNLSLATLCNGVCSVSKLSKIENRRQEPGIFLAETLLNRLGYSERDFVFYGNKSEAALWHQKNFLISQDRQGIGLSDYISSIIESGIDSDVHNMKQLCLLIKNSTEASKEQCDELIKALKISLPDYDIKNISQNRLSWIEISILNRLCTNYIMLKEYDLAALINNALCSYASKVYITPGYKNVSLLLSIRLRYRYLYNLGKYEEIINELAAIKDEFILKSANSAADIFFYAAQANGELKRYDEMITDARISAGFFLTIGATRRKHYLLSEIKRQFGIDI